MCDGDDIAMMTVRVSVVMTVCDGVGTCTGIHRAHSRGDGRGEVVAHTRVVDVDTHDHRYLCVRESVSECVRV